MKVHLPLLILVMGVFKLTAQSEPVKWTFDARQINEAEYELIITADIDHNWSIYSQHLASDKGPVATSFEFYRQDKVSLLGATAESGIKKESFDELFGMNLVKFVRKARFVQRVKVTDSTLSVRGQLTYMSCDDKSCLPPTDVDFDIALP
ncbi:MAG: sugar transporter [Bacteroidota bacterium]